MITKQKQARLPFRYIILLLALSLTITGCGGAAPTLALDVRPTTAVQVGKEVAIVASTNPPESLNLKWSITNASTAEGTLNPDTGVNVIFTASKAGTAFIVAEGTTANGAPIRQTVTLTVESQAGEATTAPIATAIATPTAAPTTALATAVPLPTAAPTTALATSTPTGPPLLDIFSQAVDGEAFPFSDTPDSLTTEIIEDADCRHAGQYGLRLTYDYTGGGNGGWGVHWAKAPEGHFDASQFTALTFWVKGTARSGFRIGLKDTSPKEFGVASPNYVVVSTSTWRPVSIPLNKFVDGKESVNIASLENINFGFNRDNGSGSICIDDIAFAK